MDLRWPDLMLSQTMELTPWPNIFSTRDLLSDSDVRHWSKVCGFNRAIERVFSLNATCSVSKDSFKSFCKGGSSFRNGYWGISEKWDPRPETFEARDPKGETRDQRPRTHLKGPRPGTWDPEPLRWNPRPENRNPYLTWDPRPDPQDTERETWVTYDSWNGICKINISCWTLDARTMTYMNLIKCPINRIW